MPFALRPVLATPFPRKSRHRSDVKRLPQSALQPLSPSLTLIAFFTLLLFVVSSISNDCASTLIQERIKRPSLVFLIKSGTKLFETLPLEEARRRVLRKDLVGVQYREVAIMN
jgi:hypothetical protein